MGTAVSRPTASCSRADSTRRTTGAPRLGAVDRACKLPRSAQAAIPRAHTKNAAVIELLVELRSRLSLSLLFITHNLGVVAAIADYVMILDRGMICEEGPVEQVFAHPRSERAIELLEAAPTLRFAV